jgi:hypothetical protein
LTPPNHTISIHIVPQKNLQLSDRFSDLEEVCNIFRTLRFCTRRNPERHFQAQCKVLRADSADPFTEGILRLQTEKIPPDTEIKGEYCDQELVTARQRGHEMLTHYQLGRDVYSYDTKAVIHKVGSLHIAIFHPNEGKFRIPN